MIVVDRPTDYGWRLGPNSHLVSTLPGLEGSIELDNFRVMIGLSKKWIQMEGTEYEHYDLTTKRYEKVVKLGVKVVSRREIIRIIQSKREANR